MKKLYLFLFLFFASFSLYGCKKNSHTVNDINFSMEFKTMDKDNDSALFIVSGLPNEEEFNQLSDVVVNSLTAQNIPADKIINVTLQSPEIDGKTISFGSCQFQNGKIIKNDIKNVTEEKYLNYLGTK